MAKTEKYAADQGPRRGRLYAYLAAVAATLAIFYVGYTLYSHYEAERRAAQEHYQAHHQDIVTAALVDVDGKQHVLRVWSNPFPKDACEHGEYVDLVSSQEGKKIWSRSDLPLHGIPPTVIIEGQNVALISERHDEKGSRVFVLDISNGQTKWDTVTNAEFIKATMTNNAAFAIWGSWRGEAYRWSDGQSCGDSQMLLNAVRLSQNSLVTNCSYQTEDGGDFGPCRYTLEGCSIKQEEPLQTSEPIELDGAGSDYRLFCEDPDKECDGYSVYRSSPDHGIALDIRQVLEPRRAQLLITSAASRKPLWQTTSRAFYASLEVDFEDGLVSVHLVLPTSDMELGIDAETGKVRSATSQRCHPVGEGYTCGKILYTKDWKLVANDKNGLPNPDQDYRALLSKYEPDIPWADQVDEKSGSDTSP